MVWENFATMLGNISLFGVGSGIILIGLIIGLTRGMTENKKQWWILFPSICMFLAFILPTTRFANWLFVIGLVGTTITWLGLANRGESEILSKPATYITLSIIIGVMTFAFNASNPLAMQESTIYQEFSDWSGTNQGYIEEDICMPGDEVCEGKVLTDNQDTSLFDPFFSGMQIFTWIGKVVSLLGYIVLGPIILLDIIANLITDNVSFWLITLLGLLLQTANIVTIYRLVTNRRGER